MCLSRRRSAGRLARSVVHGMPGEPHFRSRSPTSSTAMASSPGRIRGVGCRSSSERRALVLSCMRILTADRMLILNVPNDPNDDVFSQVVTFECGHHPTFSSLEGWGEEYCSIVAG